MNTIVSVLKKCLLTTSKQQEKEIDLKLTRTQDMPEVLASILHHDHRPNTFNPQILAAFVCTMKDLIWTGYPSQDILKKNNLKIKQNKTRSLVYSYFKKLHQWYTLIIIFFF